MLILKGKKNTNPFAPYFCMVNLHGCFCQFVGNSIRNYKANAIFKKKIKIKNEHNTLIKEKKKKKRVNTTLIFFQYFPI